MRTRHFDRIPYNDRDVSLLMKEAGLIVVRRHGRMTVDEQGSMLVAQVDGYTFRYYPMDPGEGTGTELPPLPLEVGNAWPTTTHCLDIEGSELLFGLAFDVRGISPRRFVRGPWEYEIARAAGLHKHLFDSRPLPPCFPESRSRRCWSLADLRPARKRRLRMPIRFSVAGYAHCMHDLLPSGSDFDRIVAAIARNYRKSRSYDGNRSVCGDGTVSSFGIWGWVGERPVRLGKRMKKPDMSYWVSPVGGFEAAAALLLLLDKEYSAEVRSPDPTRTICSPT